MAGSTSLRREKRQEDLPFFAYQTDEAVRLPRVSSFKVRLPHDDHPDGSIFDLGIGGGDGQRFYIENEVLDRRRSLLKREQASSTASFDGRVIGSLRTNRIG